MEDSEKSKIIIVPVSGINPDLFNKLFDKLIKSINEYFDIHDNFSSNNSSHDETSISKLKNLGEETFKTAKIEDERVKAEIINTYANIEFKKINIERKNEKAKLDNLKKLKEELLKDIKIKCSLIKVLIENNQIIVSKDIENFIRNVEISIDSNSQDYR